MKLELKHITTYLPFELRVNLLGSSLKVYGVPLFSLDLRRNAIEGIYIVYDGVRFTLDEIQPILQPLSQYKDFFGKPMSDLGGDIAHEHEISSLANKEISLASVSYASYNLMAENKVDMFGLIDAALAVDANSLNAKIVTKFKNL